MSRLEKIDAKDIPAVKAALHKADKANDAIAGQQSVINDAEKSVLSRIKPVK